MKLWHEDWRLGFLKHLDGKYTWKLIPRGIIKRKDRPPIESSRRFDKIDQARIEAKKYAEENDLKIWKRSKQ